jgi:hypothetical protein
MRIGGVSGAMLFKKDTITNGSSPIITENQNKRSRAAFMQKS